MLAIEAPVMLLDEATAALTGDEVEFLKSLIAKTRERAAIIYVSHRLSEVLELSDRLYVRKDGSVVASMPVADATKASSTSAWLAGPGGSSSIASIFKAPRGRRLR
jgi:ribose transport system ATP-binding protein